MKIGERIMEWLSTQERRGFTVQEIGAGVKMNPRSFAALYTPLFWLKFNNKISMEKFGVSWMIKLR